MQLKSLITETISQWLQDDVPRLAAALSFVLGHWWARRRFVDVTRSFESMWAARDQDAAPQRNLSAQLDEISELLKRPGSARAGRSTGGSPGKVDLSAVQNRLSSIEQKIEEVDLRDGVADGRLGAPAQCRDCGHKVSPKRSYCFYCGASLTVLPLS